MSKLSPKLIWSKQVRIRRTTCMVIRCIRGSPGTGHVEQWQRCGVLRVYGWRHSMDPAQQLAADQRHHAAYQTARKSILVKCLEQDQPDWRDGYYSQYILLVYDRSSIRRSFLVALRYVYDVASGGVRWEPGVLGSSTYISQKSLSLVAAVGWKLTKS